MRRDKSPLQGLADDVSDQVESFFDMLAEGILVAGAAVLVGTVAGKAAPAIVEQVKAALSPAPNTPTRPGHNTPKRVYGHSNVKKRPKAQKALPRPQKGSQKPVLASEEVIDLVPGSDGVYR